MDYKNTSRNETQPEPKPGYIQKISERSEEPTIKIKDFKKHYQPEPKK